MFLFSHLPIAIMNTEQKSSSNAAPEAKFDARAEVAKRIAMLNKASTNYTLYKPDAMFLQARMGVAQLALQQAIIGNDEEVRKMLIALDRDEVRSIPAGFVLESELPKAEKPAWQFQGFGNALIATPAYLEQKLMMVLAALVKPLIHRRHPEELADKDQRSIFTSEEDRRAIYCDFAATENIELKVQKAWLRFDRIKQKTPVYRMCDLVLQDIIYHTVDGQVMHFHDIVQNKKLFLSILVGAIMRLGDYLASSRTVSDVNFDNFATTYDCFADDVLGFVRSIDVRSNRLNFDEELMYISGYLQMREFSQVTDAAAIIHKQD